MKYYLKSAPWRGCSWFCLAEMSRHAKFCGQNLPVPLRPKTKHADSWYIISFSFALNTQDNQPIPIVIDMRTYETWNTWLASESLRIAINRISVTDTIKFERTYNLSAFETSEWISPICFQYSEVNKNAIVIYGEHTQLARATKRLAVSKTFKQQVRVNLHPRSLFQSCLWRLTRRLR